VNLLEKQLSTVYFEDVRFAWVTLYFGFSPPVSIFPSVPLYMLLVAQKQTVDSRQPSKKQSPLVNQEALVRKALSHQSSKASYEQTQCLLYVYFWRERQKQ